MWSQFEFSKNHSCVSYFFVYLKPVSLCILVFLVEYKLVNVDCIARSSPPQVFLRKTVLKIYSKFIGEQPCGSVISIKLQSNFIEITLRHVCSPVNLLHIFRTPFYKSIYGALLLYCLPYIILTKQPGECLKKFLQLKRIVKLQAVWLQIYWKRTSLHVLLRSFTNNISFLYTLSKFRSIYFQGTPLWS